MDDVKGGAQVTRLFRAGDLRFSIATSCVEDCALLEALFADLLDPEPSSAHETTQFEFTREPTGSEGQWLVAWPGLAAPSPIRGLSSALTQLMSALNRSALDAQPGSLHLHAAAAAREGSAVVIAAQRNTGKTTTVARLIDRGWEFLTDEMVALGTEDDLIRGFPKPLSIKPDGRKHFEHHEAAMVPRGDDDDARFRFISASAAGALVGAEGRPHLVILLVRDTAATETPQVQYQQLHPADAVVKLMQETFDAERFGSTAARLAELAVGANCFELHAGSPDATADTIEELFTLAPPTAEKIAELPTSSAFGAHVITLRVGERVVVHDRQSGRIFALDPTGTRVWEKLAGWSTDPEIDLAGPAIAPLVAQLDGLGVLAEAND